MGLRHTIDDARGAARSDGGGACDPSTADFPGADGLRRRLAAISEDVDSDELAPTDAAKNALFADIGGLSIVMAAEDARVPRPHVSSLGGGDLQCYWSQDSRHLSLAITLTGGRRLQELVSDDEGTQTLAVVDEPDRDQLLAAIRWVLGHNVDIAGS